MAPTVDAWRIRDCAGRWHLRGSGTICRGARSRTTVEVKAVTQEKGRKAFTSRRRDVIEQMAIAMAAATIAPSKAFALLPDDDDEELIMKAKAKRQSALQKELAKEQEYVVRQGLKRATKEDISTVQLAVAKLVKAASLLDEGDLGQAAVVLGDSSSEWAANLKSLADRTGTKVKGDLGRKVLDSFSDLRKAVRSKNVDKSKLAYLEAASILKDWCQAIGIDSKIKGL